jgi:hypothetical protein
MALSKYPEVQSDIVDLNSFIADSLNTRHESSRFEVDRVKGFILIGATDKPYNKECVVKLVQEILDLGTERVQKNQV